MNCDKECDTCQVNCTMTCPLCGCGAIEVPAVTVLSLAKTVVDLNDIYYLCTKNSCKCAYFSESMTISTDQLRTKIWFKSTYDEYIVCYCRNIYLKDVVRVCHEVAGDLTVEKLLKYLKLEQNDENKKCLTQNPTGQSCERLLKNAVEYAKQIYENQKKQGE